MSEPSEALQHTVTHHGFTVVVQPEPRRRQSRAVQVVGIAGAVGLFAMVAGHTAAAIGLMVLAVVLHRILNTVQATLRIEVVDDTLSITHKAGRATVTTNQYTLSDFDDVRADRKRIVMVGDDVIVRIPTEGTDARDCAWVVTMLEQAIRHQENLHDHDAPPETLTDLGADLQT